VFFVFCDSCFPLSRWPCPAAPWRFLWAALLGPPTLVAFLCGLTGLLPQVVAKKCNPGLGHLMTSDSLSRRLFDQCLLHTLLTYELGEAFENARVGVLIKSIASTALCGDAAQGFQGIYVCCVNGPTASTAGTVCRI
jgi:hypothetical protein